MPTPLIPQNNPTIVQPKVAPEVKTVILKDTIVIQSQLVDTDNDGVIDAVDKCPTVAGSPANYGCPLEISQEVKKVMITAMQNVQFETGKATLENKSYELLDQVVRVMQEHPEYRLRIEGHTDNIGNENINQMLSQSRAIVCLQYLVSKGIESSRLSSAGFGATRPIADNNAKDGRDRNRRVEFIIH
jgi:outer membrane protein OmpA-like peptidoglycan-associated protein